MNQAIYLFFSSRSLCARLHWSVCSGRHLAARRAECDHLMVAGSAVSRTYPLATLEESRMVVSSSGFVTAGAALAYVDLALWLIRPSNPAIAESTARFLMIEPRASQSIFAIPDHLADPVVERFERWAQHRLRKGFSLGEAGSAVGPSERILSRRLRGVPGKSPLSYFQDLLIEHAVHRPRTSNDSIELIAAQVGYADGTALRSLLRRKLGRAVSELHIPCR